MTGGQAVVKALKEKEIKHVFGLIGSSTIEVFDALYEEKKIKFIGVRDEKTGTHMADGYARVTGHPSIMLAGQNGPGATNLVTGIAQDNFLMLVFSLFLKWGITFSVNNLILRIQSSCLTPGKFDHTCKF